jgi:hypothetical protein
MDSQTEKYKYKIVDFNDCVIILTVFYVYFDISYINVLIDGMKKKWKKCQKKYISWNKERPAVFTKFRMNFSYTMKNSCSFNSFI